MTNLPTPYAAAKIAAFLAEHEHLSWTAYWDKRDGLWRVWGRLNALAPISGSHGAWPRREPSRRQDP